MDQNKKYFFGWQNIKWFILEWLKTYSNQPSFFASKRIERSFLFGAALIMTIVYFAYHVKLMASGDLMLITGGLFVYAGYNTVQMRKDKKVENENTEIK